jgi:nucleoid-associated protein YgaU
MWKRSLTMPVSKSDDELAAEIIRQQEQQELEAKAEEMREAQRQRMEEAKERIRARREARQAEQEEQTYTVKAGDTLGKIAQELYGDGSRWTEIYEANKDQIADPNVIEIGQVLRIP